MDQVYLMKVFVAVGEQVSFAAAARHLDISPAAVTRAVAALEHRLGVKLVERSTRQVRLTDVGARYLDDCRPILASIRQANEAVASRNAQLAGRLSVTAPVMFGKALVMPCILDYMHCHPQVEVAAFFQDRMVDLMNEEVDVAVRIGHLPDSGLRALRIGTTRRLLCAAPRYLERHGLPGTPDDLRGHAVIAASNAAPFVDWRFDAQSVRIKPRFTATSNEVAASAAIAGIGIARFHHYQVSDALARGELAIILQDFEPVPWPIHIVHRETRHGSARVRAFIDLLAGHLRSHPGVVQ